MDCEEGMEEWIDLLEVEVLISLRLIFYFSDFSW